MKNIIEFKDCLITLKGGEKLDCYKTDLKKWIKRESLEKVKEFTDWSYSVNRTEKHFRIIACEGGKWEVYEPEKESEAYFSFDCKNGSEFIKLFEEGLIEVIERENYDPYAFPSPEHPVNLD